MVLVDSADSLSRATREIQISVPPVLQGLQGVRGRHGPATRDALLSVQSRTSGFRRGQTEGKGAPGITKTLD